MSHTKGNMSDPHTYFFTFQVLVMHDLGKNFTNFTFITIYQLAFFILFTTIGLNIIYGIIVDTFSELRDLKASFCCAGKYLFLFVIQFGQEGISHLFFMFVMCFRH